MPQLHYLGEVGHLAPPFDNRTSVTYGNIRVVLRPDGALRIEGRDNSGSPWGAILRAEGGVGWTDVWRADIDRDGHPDLLVAAYFPQNGRCIDEITLSFLLFNSKGQPVPWVVHTRMPESKGLPAIPALFTDLEHSGRLKLVVTECSYSEPPRFGEDRQITGIYEANDATWSLVRPANMAAYTALVRHNYRFRPEHDVLLPSDPVRWANLGNELDPHGPPPVQLDAVLPRSPECRGVRLPPIVTGQLQRDWKDPCDEVGKDRIRLSNGTICYGWPAVVIDTSSGREIVAESKELAATLQNIASEKRTVVLAGEADPERCSPTLLWAMRK